MFTVILCIFGCSSGSGRWAKHRFIRSATQASISAIRQRYGAGADGAFGIWGDVATTTGEILIHLQFLYSCTGRGELRLQL